MRRKLIYYVLFAAYFLKVDKIVAVYRNGMLGVDPISDFRCPQSLTEVLHEGLIEVEALIRSAQCGDSDGQSLRKSQDLLNTLSDSYDRMVNKSKIHEVYHDDRAFLQSMIDRIDAMLQALGDDGSAADNDADLVSQNADLLHVLKNKMGG